jgi:hypothetical protein
MSRWNNLAEFISFICSFWQPFRPRALAIVCLLPLTLSIAQAAITRHETNQCSDSHLSVETRIAGGHRVSANILLGVGRCGILKGIYWGGTDKPPTTIVRGVGLMVDGRALPIPVSSFAGLADISHLAIVSSPGGFIVRLISRGEEPYRADLYFSRSKIIKRRVYYPLFTEEAYEETVYHFVEE